MTTTATANDYEFNEDLFYTKVNYDIITTPTAGFSQIKLIGDTKDFPELPHDYLEEFNIESPAFSIKKTPISSPSKSIKMTTPSSSLAKSSQSKI